jgi:phosphoglycerate dehydrogenase-like enzyme
MTVICLPDELSRHWLTDSASADTVLVWDGVGAPPAGIEQVEFLVPPYRGGAWSTAVLAQLPALRLIQLLTAGTDPWIEVTPAGVLLCRGGGLHGSSTAELAVTGLLMHWLSMPILFSQQTAHRWQRVGRETSTGKRVLIVGAGDIGSHVARVLRALGCVVSLVGRTARDGVLPAADLLGLVPDHDALVVSTPLTAQTIGLVDAELLALLPDRAVVVNVARGPIVVTADLLAELRSARLRAVLDVTDPEPLPPGHPLWSAPGLILTPHVGGGAIGWMDRAGALVRDQLRRFQQGEPLTNLVGPIRTEAAGPTVNA